MAQAGASAEADPIQSTAPDFGVTGDWGGLRSHLLESGANIQLTQIGEAIGVAKGGLRQHSTAEGRLQADLDINGAQAFSWPGLTLHANSWVLQGGQGPSRCCVGNIATVSNIEARPSARLFTVWAQQSFLEDRLSVRAGKLAADDEFASSQVSALFTNSAFGWPTFMGANLPAGGPIFPLGAIGARIKAAFGQDVTILAATFSGDPVKPGPGDPLIRQPDGLFFDWVGGNFTIAEFQFRPHRDDGADPNNFHVGIWFHDGNFNDLRNDQFGRSLADPLTSGIARQHGSDWGAYAMCDIHLWRDPANTGRDLSGFITLGSQPRDRNAVSLMVSAGINFRGMAESRPDDVFGLAFAYLHMSQSLTSLDNDSCRFSGICGPRRDFEFLVEMTHQIAITPWWSLQPNLQYIAHPGGNISQPGTNTAIPDAIYGGLRTSFRL